MDEGFCSPREGALLLGYRERALYDRQFRQRLGLVAYKLATGAVRFRRRDILNLLQPESQGDDAP